MSWLEVPAKPNFIPKGTIALIIILFISFWLQWILSEAFVKTLYLNHFSLIQLVTHQFFHVHIIHLLFNLGLLYIFGQIIEERIGTLLLVVGFFFLGVTAGISHIIFNGNQAIGASGAISGLIGLAFIITPKTKIYFFDRTFSVSIWFIAVCWITKDILFLAMPAMHSASWGHLGGFFVGALCGLIIKKISPVTV